MGLFHLGARAGWCHPGLLKVCQHFETVFKIPCFCLNEQVHMRETEKRQRKGREREGVGGEGREGGRERERVCVCVYVCVRTYIFFGEESIPFK